MCWLPVIESFVTILDRRETGCDDVGDKEDVESLDRLDRVDTRTPGQPLASTTYVN